MFGLLVKRLRRRPLTAKTGVRFPYRLRLFLKNSPTQRMLKPLRFEYFFCLYLKRQQVELRLISPPCCPCNFSKKELLLTLFMKTPYFISRIQPSGASILPIWIPVSVSYNFFVTGPISSIPLGKQISLP